MNIEKLKKTIEKKDIKEFCNIFFELGIDEILRLSEKEYDEFMELCSKLKDNEKLMRVEEFLIFLRDEGDGKLDNATEGRSVLENLFISKFYFDLFLSLSNKKDSGYAITLTKKGISLRTLAEHGIETESNLKEALKCFDEAESIFKREKSDLGYARMLMSKGLSLKTLAEHGIETESNLKESLKCFNEAESILRRDKSDLDYAGTLTNKGISLRTLAEHGIETESNSKESLKCFDEAASIFKRGKSDLGYAITLTNKGLALRILAEHGEVESIKNDIVENLLLLLVLAEHGIETESNLKEALKCFDEEAPIYKREKSDLIYAITITIKGIVLRTLAEQGIKTGSNLKESLKCFDEAASIFKRDKSDLGFARMLISKGLSLKALAEHGIETESNLKESLLCFDEAAQIYKREKSDLNYVETLFNKGIILGTLAEHGIETESNLKESLKCFDEAESILKREKSDLNYARMLISKGLSLKALAENGIETESNLKESLKCFDEAAPIYKREKSDLNYATTLSNKGIILGTLAEHGIETENNFERAISSYVEAEDIFYKKSSFLMFVTTSLNHGIALWWRYTETKEDNYLEGAKEILKGARRESVLVVHPAKEQLSDLLIHIYDTITDEHKASKKEFYEEMHKKMDMMLSHASMLPGMREDLSRIDVKTDIIIDFVQKIEISCNRIISNLEDNGVKLKEADKEELITLADDLKRANDEQLANFTRELIELLGNPKLKKEIKKKTPKRLRSIVKKTFTDMTHILNELSIALGAAITAEELLPNIEAIMHQITILSEISPAFASTLILIPLITFKVKTVK